MTEAEVRQALHCLAAEKQGELQERRQSLTTEQKNERRALTIASNIAGHCAAFSECMFCGNFSSVAHKRIFEEMPQYFGARRAEYDALPEQEKAVFLRYAFSVVMVRSTFLDAREKQLEQAGAQADPEHVFEARVISGVCTSILGAWNRWYASAGGPLYA